MIVELQKSDLISLVMGTSPRYSVLEHELVKPSGRWVGGFVDEWRWNGLSLAALTEEELWRLYCLCRDGEN